MYWPHIQENTLLYTHNNEHGGSFPVQPQSSSVSNWNAPGWSTMLKGTFSAATEKEFVLFLLDLN